MTTTRCALLMVLFALANLCVAEDRLPRPDYDRRPTDPEWLARVVQFHGHLGPSVVLGARMGQIGLRTVEAKGYFDVEVTCRGPFAKPPQACFLDGVQVTTGATIGKRTLASVQADSIVLRITNTRTGTSAELRPTSDVMQLIGSYRPRPKAGAGHRDEELEAIARKIAAMPERQIAEITAHAR